MNIIGQLSVVGSKIAYCSQAISSGENFKLVQNFRHNWKLVSRNRFRLDV